MVWMHQPYRGDFEGRNEYILTSYPTVLILLRCFRSRPSSVRRKKCAIFKKGDFGRCDHQCTRGSDRLRAIEGITSVVVVTIPASGDCLPPFAITVGKQVKPSWSRLAPSGTQFAVSSKASMEQSLFKDYLSTSSTHSHPIFAPMTDPASHRQSHQSFERRGSPAREAAQYSYLRPPCEFLAFPAAL